MCTIVAKKFPNIGWVGVKNRDRPTATRTELFRDQEDGFQRVTLMDEDTRWTEGMNSNGVSIISSSLSPITNGVSKHPSKDGHIIREALAQPTIDKAVSLCRNQGIGGCVMIFDADRLFLIEGKVGNDRRQVIREIHGNNVARTNHGIWIPEAGYQPHNKNPILQMRRISSVARLDIANFILDSADKPEELMPLLAKQWVNNPQLTTLRTTIQDIDTRTTEQLMLEPGKKLVLVRNVNGELEFDQKDANPPGSEVLVGVVQL
jgi:hypothetical protein